MTTNSYPTYSSSNSTFNIPAKESWEPWSQASALNLDLEKTKVALCDLWVKSLKVITSLELWHLAPCCHAVRKPEPLGKEAIQSYLRELSWGPGEQPTSKTPDMLSGLAFTWFHCQALALRLHPSWMPDITEQRSYVHQGSTLAHNICGIMPPSMEHTLYSNSKQNSLMQNTSRNLKGDKEGKTPF